MLRKLRQVIRALGDETRLRIINVLSEKEFPVHVLCSVLGKNQSLLSKHLARLRLSGLVIDRREGSRVYYRINHALDEPVARIMRLLGNMADKIEQFEKDREKVAVLE